MQLAFECRVRWHKSRHLLLYTTCFSRFVVLVVVGRRAVIIAVSMDRFQSRRSIIGSVDGGEMAGESDNTTIMRGCRKLFND